MENIRHRVLIAKKLAIGILRRPLTPRANMNAPIRDAVDCSSRKPMRRHFVSGFPRALLSLSQEESSGVEIVKMAVRFPELSESDLTVGICENKLGDQMIKQLLNLVIAKCRDL